MKLEQVKEGLRKIVKDVGLGKPIASMENFSIFATALEFLEKYKELLDKTSNKQ